MKTLFSTQELKNLAKSQFASFSQTADDTILIIYECKSGVFTDVYYGSEKNGFKKHYN